MDMQTVIICFLLSSVNGLKGFIDEFNRNFVDDNTEYDFIEPEDNLKSVEHYFREIRSIEEDYRNIERIDTEEYYLEPENGDNLNELTRNKRDAPNLNKNKENKIDKLGNPLEIIILNVDNDTETIHDEMNTNDLKINDFIRFKRGVDNEETEESRRKREKENNSQNSRTKQEYPINREEKSDVRAPRVHFVTQRRSESSQLPGVRNLNSEHDYYPQKNYERYSRRYNPLPYQKNYYDTPYFEPERGYYNGNIQRRIIYYASLPEDVRSPNDRYNYRDTYLSDPRYLNAQTQNQGDIYRYRKPYASPKSRYDDVRLNKTFYPTKVSADVNVREVKKNPERRIYSEVDRRYDYDLPPYYEHDPYRM